MLPYSDVLRYPNRVLWNSLSIKNEVFLNKEVNIYYKCNMALPRGAVGWSAVCNCGIFLTILTSGNVTITDKESTHKTGL